MTPSKQHGYLSKQFGEAITRHRVTAGKSQRAQAREIGIAGNTLREIELGLANPTLDRVESLAEDLGLVVELVVRKAKR